MQPTHLTNIKKFVLNGIPWVSELSLSGQTLIKSQYKIMYNLFKWCPACLVFDGIENNISTLLNILDEIIS